MCRNAGIISIRPIYGRPGKSQIHPGHSRHSRKKPAAADVWKETDAGFGHRKAQTFACDPVGSIKADADAAAHHDPVDQGKMGFAQALKRPIMLVFVGVVAVGLFGIAPGPIVDCTNVATRGEGFALRFHHDSVNMRVLRTAVVEGL